MMKDAAITASPQADAAYWRFVANVRTDRSIASIAPEGLQEKPTHYLHLYDEPRSTNQYVLFASLDGAANDDRPLTHTVRIYPNTLNDRLEISARRLCAESCLGPVEVDGRTGSMLFAESLSVAALPVPDARGVPGVTIRSPHPIDARTVRVSFPRILPEVSGLEAVLERGFYGWHHVGDARWSWAEAQAQILVRNDVRPLIESTGDALAERSFEWGSFWEVELELELWAPSEQTITFLDGDGRELGGVRLSPGRLSTHGVLLRIERTSASSTIVLRSDHPAQDEAGAMVFQVHGLRLRTPLVGRDFE